MDFLLEENKSRQQYHREMSSERIRSKYKNVQYEIIKRQLRNIFMQPQGGLGNVLKQDTTQSPFSKTDENTIYLQRWKFYMKLCTTGKIKIKLQNDKKHNYINQKINNIQWNTDNVNIHNTQTAPHAENKK